MNTEIVLKNVNKFYGKNQALKDISLTIPNGMFGLLGRNGAGKTTLMKILATLHNADTGKVMICGLDVEERAKIRDKIGYLPQDFTMYGTMSVYEVMDYLGTLAGLKKKERALRIPQMLDKVNLQNNYKTKVKAMSGGMRRRLGIAQALLNNPQVLIVDEPTAGLDPEERVRFRNLLCEIADQRIVILSTHIVGDIEATCENIAILHEGELCFSGKVSELLNIAKGKIYIAEISKLELEEMKSKYIVTGMLTKGSKVEVRFVSEDNSFPYARSVEPNVEDAYLYLMNGKEKV
ncbi:ABC transporter ATP-binding protein [Anaerosacchariphilus polymeriproducens]|uniref:ABC transporter ATP-binding protein n=1 Tax=Anaerosacchariphilus polymeriproducens TaxID=1812858 RepID=A0A371AZE7_9FIRM|nr:ABC transporter ATP-binding protein [Anaerosacchariphilus polymeriproducens]RDU24872.1 ABC transporter ATP-binding protein [Anaerosacchariphilus polymeriproducens]